MTCKLAMRFGRMLGLCLLEIFTVAASCQVAPSLPQKQGKIDASRSSVQRMSANIPFEFWIGPQKMPSGNYTVEVLVPSVSIVRSADGSLEQEVYMVDIGPAVTQQESRLIFVIRNGKQELTEIWCVSGKRGLAAQNPHQDTPGKVTVVTVSYKTPDFD